MNNLDFLPHALAGLAATYEGEPYWSLEKAGEVIDSTARAGKAVTGVEQWRFEPGFTGPRVLQFSTYRLKKNVPWPEVVEDARRKAHQELGQMTGADTVCQISWIGNEARPT